MKRFIKCCVVLITIIIFFTLVATAATDDGVFTANSNRQSYTPKSCDIQVRDQNVFYTLLSWSDVEYGAAYYWEGELRAVNGNISDAYSNVTAVSGSLPYIYKEYDKDDVTVGCKNMAGIKLNTHYYATLYVDKGPKFDQGVDLLFESEYGLWGIVDGLPLHYQVFAGQMNTKSAKGTAWVS